jgi:hypothetical protein
MVLLLFLFPCFNSKTGFGVICACFHAGFLLLDSVDAFESAPFKEPIGRPVGQSACFVQTNASIKQILFLKAKTGIPH